MNTVAQDQRYQSSVEARSGERCHRRIRLAGGADGYEWLLAQPLPDELDGPEGADATNVSNAAVLLGEA